MSKNKVIGAVLVAVAILSTINLDIDLAPEGPQYPRPTPFLQEALEPLKADFAGPADLVGLFDAIGIEILNNETLVKVADIKRLNILVTNRFLPLVNWELVPGLGARLDALLLTVEADPNAELTPELREAFAEVYFGLEWLVREAKE